LNNELNAHVYSNTSIFFLKAHSRGYEQKMKIKRNFDRPINLKDKELQTKVNIPGGSVVVIIVSAEMKYNDR